MGVVGVGDGVAGTLNTISFRMKSTLRVEVCCPLAAGAEQLVFWIPNTELRCASC